MLGPGRLNEQRHRELLGEMNKLEKALVLKDERIAELKAIAMCVLTDPDDPNMRCILVEQKDAQIAGLRQILQAIVDMNKEVTADCESPKHMQAYLYHEMRKIAKAALTDTPQGAFLSLEELQEKLDLMRTMSIPAACNETDEQWAQHKVIVMSGWLAAKIKQAKGE